MFDTPWALLAAASIAAAMGMAWLALAMEVHWEQVQGRRPLARPIQILLRMLGILGLALSLGLCMAADHISMAVLVWVMMLATGAVFTAFLLTWKPACFAPLVVWLPFRFSQQTDLFPDTRNKAE